LAISRYVTINDTEVQVSGFIYRAIEDELLSYDTVISKEGMRIDQYAYKYYEDADDWWLIAAASGIGWWLQVPPGIVLRIPNNITQVEKFIQTIGEQ